MRKTGVDKPCETCSKDFYASGWNSTARYCSVTCSRTGKLLACLWCGKEAYVPKNRLETYKYCSRRCGGKANPPLVIPTMKGRKHTPETIEKMRISATGVRHSPETLKKMRLVMLGKRTGSANSMWKGGVTPKNQKIRGSDEYKQWRKSVFQRDDYTCQICEARGVTLNADHIKRFAEYPELRFQLSNGRTLCVPCHKDTPTWGTKGMVGFKGKNKIHV